MTTVIPGDESCFFAVRRDKGLVDNIYFSMFGGTMLRGKKG